MKSIKVVFFLLLSGLLVMSSSCTKKIKGCHLQAKVDGELVEYNDVLCTKAMDIFSMLFNDGSVVSMSFNIENLDGKGSYTLDSLSSNVSLLLTLDDGSKVIAHELTVEVTRYESNGIEGTFSGKGVKTGTAKVFDITGGSFAGEF